MGAADIIFSTVFPIVGSILGYVLASTPIKAVQAAEKLGKLGDLNPLPSCVFMINCLMWLSYGVAKEDPYIYFGNGPIAPICLYLILHSYGLADVQVRKQMEGFLSSGTLSVLVVAGFYVFSPDIKTSIAFNGAMAVIVNILLYASPLTSIGTVIKERNSASILLSWTLAGMGSSVCWLTYGLVTKQIPVVIPQTFGVALNLTQLALRSIYPAIPTSKSTETTEEPADQMEGGAQAAVVYSPRAHQGGTRTHIVKKSASRLGLVDNDALGESGPGQQPRGQAAPSPHGA